MTRPQAHLTQDPDNPSATTGERSQTPPLESAGGRNFLENFIDKYFLTLPPWARVAVYFIILLTFVHSFLKPTILEGTIWQKNELTETPAVGYSIQTANYSFKANEQGHWILKTNRKIPGKMRVDVIDTDGCRVGAVHVNLPIPFISHLLESSYAIFHDEITDEVKIAEAYSGLDWPVATAYAQTDSRTTHQRAASRIRVKIRKLTVKESGDLADEIGRIYFRVFINGEEFDTPTLPQKKYPNTDLTIRDNSVNVFDKLQFTVPWDEQDLPMRLRIQIFDREGIRIRGFRLGKEDLVGDFIFTIGIDISENIIDVASSDMALGGRENSSIQLELVRL